MQLIQKVNFLHHLANLKLMIQKTNLVRTF